MRVCVCAAGDGARARWTCNRSARLFLPLEVRPRLAQAYSFVSCRETRTPRPSPTLPATPSPSATSHKPHVCPQRHSRGTGEWWAAVARAGRREREFALAIYACRSLFSCCKNTHTPLSELTGHARRRAQPGPDQPVSCEVGVGRNAGERRGAPQAPGHASAKAEPRLSDSLPSLSRPGPRPSPSHHSHPAAPATGRHSTRVTAIEVEAEAAPPTRSEAAATAAAAAPGPDASASIGSPDPPPAPDGTNSAATRRSMTRAV